MSYITRMKTCCTCKNEKPLNSFGVSRSSSDGRNKRCLECSRIAATKWYQANTPLAKIRVKKNVKKIRSWYHELKKTLKCSRCPEKHPSCLEFHHRDPSVKDNHVSRMFMLGSKERILDEIKKCDVLCANCHRKLHDEIKFSLVVHG